MEAKHEIYSMYIQLNVFWMEAKYLYVQRINEKFESHKTSLEVKYSKGCPYMTFHKFFLFTNICKYYTLYKQVDPLNNNKAITCSTWKCPFLE